MDVASLASRAADLEALNLALTAENSRLKDEGRKALERHSKLRKQQER